MIKLGIVIPFFGGNKYIGRLLDSVVQSGNDDTEVYIIDNSLPGENFARSGELPSNVFVITARSSLGYGKACNIGYNKCIETKRDILIIANQDGYFSENSLDKLIGTLQADQDAAIAVPLLTEYDNNEVESFFTQVYLSPIEDLVGDLFSGKPRPSYKAKDLCGACFALKLKGYKHLPFLFDELYKMYYEDGDLYQRITNRLGKNVIFVPSAAFHHFHTNTKDDLQTTRLLIQKRTSRHIYTLKNTGTDFFYTVTKWFFHEFRYFIENLFQFRFKTIYVETVAVFNILGKFFKVRKSRKAEQLFHGI